MFVQPANEVTNYLTRYSGITKRTLENVTANLAEAQVRIPFFLKILHPKFVIMVAKSERIQCSGPSVLIILTMAI